MQSLLNNDPPPLQYPYVQIHTLFEMQTLVQAHICTHAHTEVLSVLKTLRCITKNILIYKYIHKFLKEKTDVTHCKCTPIFTMLATSLLPFVSRKVYLDVNRHM